MSSLCRFMMTPNQLGYPEPRQAPLQPRYQMDLPKDATRVIKRSYVHMPNIPSSLLQLLQTMRNQQWRQERILHNTFSRSYNNFWQTYSYYWINEMFHVNWNLFKVAHRLLYFNILWITINNRIKIQKKKNRFRITVDTALIIKV